MDADLHAAAVAGLFHKRLGMTRFGLAKTAERGRRQIHYVKLTITVDSVCLHK